MSLSLLNLKDKVAMVTGSTRGLGEGAAIALAKAGANVAVCGRSRTDLQRVSATIKDLDRDSDGIFLDVASKESVHQGVKQILKHFDKIDILVNNAGVNHREPVMDYPEEAWDLVINTNLKGYFLVTQVVGP